MSTPGIGSEESESATRSRRPVLGDVWINFKRWNRKAARNPSVIVVSLLQPIITLLTFGLILGGAAAIVLEETGFSDVGYVTFILPAVVMQVSLASALTSGIGLVQDIDGGMFEKVLVSPMSWSAVFAGKASAELVRISLQVLVVLLLGVGLGATVETGLLGVLGIVLICMLVSLWFMSVSNLLALVTRDEESISASTTFLQFPLLFLSTSFLPLEALPGWIQSFARINPVTYGADAVRALVLGRDVLSVATVTRFGGVYDTLVPAVAVLVVLNVVFGAVSIALMRRASSAGVD